MVSDNINKSKVHLIRWLSCLKTKSLFRSMVVYHFEKKYTGFLISQGLMKIGKKTTYTEAFQNQSLKK